MAISPSNAYFCYVIQNKTICQNFYVETPRSSSTQTARVFTNVDRNSHYVFQGIVVILAQGFEEQLLAEPRLVVPVLGPRLKGGQVPALALFLADLSRVLVCGAGVLVFEVVPLALRLEPHQLSLHRVLDFPSVPCESFKIVFYKAGECVLT